MALILAAIVAVGTIGWVVLLLFANGMSDAPSQSGMRIWPSLIGGFVIAGLLAGSHWINIGW